MKGKAKAKPKATRKRSAKGEEFAAAFGRLCDRFRMRIVGTPVILPDGRIAARVDAVPAGVK